MAEDLSNSLSELCQIDRICDDFENHWRNGKAPEIDDFLGAVPRSLQDKLLMELVAIDIDHRLRRGEAPLLETYQARFPQVPSSRWKSSETGLPRSRSPQATFSEDSLNSSGLSSTLDKAEPDRRIHYFGDYILHQKIARGGMGTVYRATQINLNRPVAVKTINSGVLALPWEIERFRSEATAAASLDHANIVPIYEVGVFEGEHFYSMALIDGNSLAAKLTAGPLEPTDAARLMRTVAVAVQFAHDHQVVHRDLKPSNILLNHGDEPRVSDFGLAKRLSDPAGLTVSGEVLGTPCFMPPEQALGQIDAVGFGSDVYSLGAILYNALTGRPPFQAATQVDTLRQVIEQEPVQLRQLNPAIPRDLETIVHKCLEKSISRRYPSARALADDLDCYLAGRPISARPVTSLERARRWCRRNPAQALNIAGVCSLLVGAVVAWWLLAWWKRDMTARAGDEKLVEQFLVADAAELPKLFDQLRSKRHAALYVAQRYESEAPGTTARLRAAMAMLPHRQQAISELCDASPSLSWEEWSWLLTQVAAHPEWTRQWALPTDTLHVKKMSDSVYARMALLHITIARSRQPAPDTAAPPWNDYERILSNALVEVRRDPQLIVPLARALRPLRVACGPILSLKMSSARTNADDAGNMAAYLLRELFAAEPARLVEYGSTARAELLPTLFNNPSDPAAMRAALSGLLQRRVPTDSWNERNEALRQRAVAAAVLWNLGDTEAVWPLLSHSSDPTVRSLLIDWIPIVQRDPSVVLARLDALLKGRAARVAAVASGKFSVPNPWLFDDASSQLRGLLQTLGGYPDVAARVDLKDMLPKLAELFRTDPDPGTHAACEWLLYRAGQAETVSQFHRGLLSATVQRSGWVSTPNGHVLALIRGPIEYQAGGDKKDPDRDAGEYTDPYDQTHDTWSEDHQHRKRIRRSFAIALHETSFAQVQRFDNDFHVLQNKTLGPTFEHPACKISWYLAAAYCNWLSEQEGIAEDQWCFTVTNSNVPTEAGNLQLAPDYLERTGYRLPTEAEWEYACRAGTTTRRYFGETDELLDRYVWHMRNSKERVLSLPAVHKPNDLGLFNAFGNVAEWCMDEFDVRTPATRFKANDASMKHRAGSDHILRGGSIYSLPSDIRASEYWNHAPAKRDGNTGFRVARTIVWTE